MSAPARSKFRHAALMPQMLIRKTRCPKCGHVQQRKTDVARVLCSGCGRNYYRFPKAIPKAPTGGPA